MCYLYHNNGEIQMISTHLRVKHLVDGFQFLFTQRIEIKGFAVFNDLFRTGSTDERRGHHIPAQLAREILTI